MVSEVILTPLYANLASDSCFMQSCILIDILPLSSSRWQPRIISYCFLTANFICHYLTAAQRGQEKTANQNCAIQAIANRGQNFDKYNSHSSLDESLVRVACYLPSWLRKICYTLFLWYWMWVITDMGQWFFYALLLFWALDSALFVFPTAFSLLWPEWWITELVHEDQKGLDSK